MAALALAPPHLYVCGRRTIKKPQPELWLGWVNLFPYVEKKTRGFAV